MLEQNRKVVLLCQYRLQKTAFYMDAFVQPLPNSKYFLSCTNNATFQNIT